MVDVIERELQKNKDILDNDSMRDQTWAEFEKVVKGKKLFMLGACSYADFFWEKYGGKFSLTGIIDNDTRKQGFPLEIFAGGSSGMKDGKLIVSNVEILKEYSPNEIVILITVTPRYYSEIKKQLNDLGIDSCFGLVVMEANDRKENTERTEQISKKDKYVEECCKLPIKREKIVVYIGTHGGHGKYITKKLLKKRQDLDIVWIVKSPSVNVLSGVRLVCEGDWKSYIYEVETAKVWIFDSMVPSFFVKRSEQIYIQAKHWSSITLKKFFLDDDKFCEIDDYVSNAHYNAKMIDYIFIGSKADECSCRTGFGYDGKFVSVGSSRSDALFEKENKEKVFQFYHLDSDKKVLLYAPTFRTIGNGTYHMKNVDMDFAQIKDALQKRFGGEWYIFLRIHPTVAIESSKVQKPEYVIDVSLYEDSQELVAASDITVSDYSSIMFEHAFVGKPVFLFAPDKKDYVNKERGLLLDYDSLPFPVAETNEELVEDIRQFDEDVYKKDVKEFLDRYGVHEDGHASERAAEFILELIS